jgi:hypothetical protein
VILVKANHLYLRVGCHTVEATLAVARCRCRVMLAMALSSLVGDVAAEATLAMA